MSLKFYVKKLCAFYSAPVTKFYLDFASYFAFVGLYTAVGLTMDYEYTIKEGFMNCWIISLAIGEVRKMTTFGLTRYNRFYKFRYDLIMLGLYAPAAVLRVYERFHYTKADFDAMPQEPIA